MPTLDLDAFGGFTDRQREARDIVMRAVSGMDDVEDLLLLYGGAAGGGKSYWCRWMLALLLIYWYQAKGLRGVRVGLFCEDYPSLEDRQLSKIESEFPKWMGKFVGIPNPTLTLTESLGGGVISFRNLKEAGRYDSAEFAAMAVDELSKNPADVFNELRKRRRWPGVPVCPFLGATNPGGAGHAWVKSLWIDRSPDEGTLGKIDNANVKFVQAFARDNPHLDPKYITANLASLPEEMRRRFEDGDWDIFEGQYLVEWRKQLHVVEPFAIPDNWPRWTATDYGTTMLKPTFATLWFAQDPETGRRFVYRELYGQGWLAAEQAQRIMDAERGGEVVRRRIGDPAMFNNVNGDGTSPADSYRKEGLLLIRGYNDRVKGWHLVREALTMWPDGRPGLQAFSTCRNLVRTAPTLMHDDHNPEDVDTDGEDHLWDAARYGLSANLAKLSVERKPRKGFWAA